MGKHLTFVGMVLLAALSFIMGAASAKPTAPGTVVSNIANVQFTQGGQSLTQFSNEENFTVMAGGSGIGTPADLKLTKRASRIVVGVGEVVMYTLRVENTGAATTALTVQDQLPAELRFRDVVPASATLSEFSPVTTDGKLLLFNVGALAAGASVEFAYFAEVVTGAEYGFVTNKAQAFEDITARHSDVAVATVLIRQDFFSDVSFIAGRVHSGGCEGNGTGVAGVRVYMEDGTFAVTDPLGRYHIEGTKPGLHVVQIDKASLPAGLTLTQCRTNTRNGGDGEAQFVDTQGGALWRADFALAGTATPGAAAAPAGQIVIDNGDWTAERLQKWLQTAPHQFALVAPAEGFYPSVGAVTIVVAHNPDETVELTLDGQPVSPLNLEGTQFNADKTWAATRWRGVDIHDGDNLLLAQTVSKSGVKGERVGRTIHFTGPPVAAAVDRQHSTLIADGKTPPVVAIKLTSAGNYPTRPGMFVDVDIEAPYRRQEIVAPEAPISHIVPSRFPVGEGGVILVPLAPTVISGEARIRVKLQGRDEVVKAWLSSGTTGTFLIGLAEGTAGHNAIQGKPDAKVADTASDGVFADGRVAFFFKSMILGDWMLKAGYDSKRNAKDRNRALGQDIAPQSYFSVYGDASHTEHEMDTAGPLFVHVERSNFMIRYGAFDTALSNAQLARYERRLQGVQSTYRGEEFSYKAFVSQTANRFIKDEIKGNGTSGLYRLSTRPVLTNSEHLKLEERDRFRNGEVVSTRTLVRDLDYQIDYDYGTIFFKEPVPSQSLKLNPLVIVAEYETTGTGKRTLNYGGRVAGHAFGGVLEVGASAIHQGSTTGPDANLFGLDATVKLGSATAAHAEFARSRDGPKGPGVAEAYMAEITHNTQAFSGRLYVRSQDAKFGLDQLNEGLSGAREYGAEARARLDSVVPGLGVAAKAYRRQSPRIAGAREFGELMLDWTSAEAELQLGMRRIKDGTTGTGPQTTDQIIASAAYHITDRLTVRSTREQSLGGRDSNPDYPTRTILGADYRISDGLTFVARHEINDGPKDKGTITRAGFEGSFWAGGRVKTSLERDVRDTAEQAFANVGLSQDWQIEDGWSLSASVDRQQRLFSNGEDNGGTPTAADRENFTAISLGTAVDTDLGKVTARVETRFGNDERFNFAVGHYLSPTDNLSFANNLRFLYENPATGSEIVTALLQLGVAYRPLDGPLVLNRIDFGYESDPRAEAESGISRDTWKIVDNTLINLQPSKEFEMSIMLGLKYAADEVLGQHRHRTFTTMSGVEARYDITDDIDIGVRGSALVNWTSSTVLYSAGPSIGYSLSDAIWISAGYNIVGYQDRDFTAAGYTSSGLFTQFRARLDSSDAESAAKWFTEN